jgi:hypothetical protein
MDDLDTDLYADIFMNLTNLYSKEINYRKNNPYFKYEKLLSFYPLFLIIIGTLCNLTSFIVLRRKSIRKYACMKYLSVLAISDMSILYSWNFNSFFKYNFSKPPFYLDLEELSLVMCKLIGFSAFFCLQLSAWLLSLVSFDRLMLVYSTKWKHFMHKPHRIHFVIAGTILTILCLNIHILFLNGYIVKNDLNFASFALQNPSETKTHLYGELITSKYLNTTSFVYIPKEEIVCYRSVNDKDYIFPKWNQAHLILYSILPFTIMLTSNLLIIYNVICGQKVESKNKASVKRKRRMTYMLILITFTFIILTLPSVLVHAFFRNTLKTKKYRRLVNLIVNNLLYTSHACNFFLYVFSAPNFRAELICMFNNLFSKRIRNSFSTTSNGNNMAIKSKTKKKTSMLSAFLTKETEIRKMTTLNVDDKKIKIENHNLMEMNRNVSSSVEFEITAIEPLCSSKQIRFNV